ncbi:MAG: nicotinamidase [Roseibium sp.]|uniref:nicotinamidase n=1 Tax=Roseibium sp. TaxID=1936156 RepID=UPI00329919DF
MNTNDLKSKIFATSNGITQAGSALVLIDIQEDFMPGGPLGVPGGDEILGPVEALAEIFDNVILSQDWHPADHKSFASNHDGKAPFDIIELHYDGEPANQVLWPDHCIQGTPGAEFRLPERVIRKAQTVIRKGFRPAIDSYSAFVENDMVTSTGLAGLLKERRITDVFFAGLALDYCVAWSALSAKQAGLNAHVILPACRGIAPISIENMTAEMTAAGVNLITEEDLA